MAKRISFCGMLRPLLVGLSFVAVLGVGFQAASAATFVCTTLKSYHLKAGALVADQYKWPRTWTFNENTGQLDYGQSKPDKLTVTSFEKDFLLSAHYFHNGVILSAIEFRLDGPEIQFIFLKGGNSLLLSGTCKQLGLIKR